MDIVPCPLDKGQLFDFVSLNEFSSYLYDRQCPFSARVAVRGSCGVSGGGLGGDKGQVQT